MNKPVAWISRLPEGDVYNCAWAEKQNDDDIPLYTHPVKELKQIKGVNYYVDAPVKELTDKEIISTMVQFDVYSNDGQCLIDAGKAILRKAQKK